MQLLAGCKSLQRPDHPDVLCQALSRPAALGSSHRQSFSLVISRQTEPGLSHGVLALPARSAAPPAKWAARRALSAGVRWPCETRLDVPTGLVRIAGPVAVVLVVGAEVVAREISQAAKRDRPLVVTRHGKTVARLTPPAGNATLQPRPWDMLRGSGELAMEPEESVLDAESFDALR